MDPYLLQLLLHVQCRRWRETQPARDRCNNISIRIGERGNALWYAWNRTVSALIPSSCFVASHSVLASTMYSFSWSLNATTFPSPEMVGGHDHNSLCWVQRSASRSATLTIDIGFSAFSSAFAQKGNSCNAPGSGTTGLLAQKHSSQLCRDKAATEREATLSMQLLLQLLPPRL